MWTESVLGRRGEEGPKDYWLQEKVLESAANKPTSGLLTLAVVFQRYFNEVIVNHITETVYEQKQITLTTSQPYSDILPVHTKW